MYSIDLSKITLDEFERVLLAVHLLPSQRTILQDLPENFGKLKSKGLSNLLELQKLLKKKDNYTSVSEEFGIDEEYLVILNRMVNSYVVKSVPIEKLEIFTKEELSEFEKENIKNTEQFYNVFISNGQINDISKKTGISADKVIYALHIIDLLRINGVGVGYAKTLYDIGIRCVADYNNTPSTIILERYRKLNEEKKLSNATLGIGDIDYCRRFCEKLDCDIS